MIELTPEPRSVGVARSWVVDELRGLGRADLADAAELGISELVTNAILHAEPPITVRIGGTPVHPRIEVHDHSETPPSMRKMNDEERLLATIGRGLGIVAMFSSSWGAEVTSGGKVVWFEPAGEPTMGLDGHERPGDVFDLGETVERRLAGLDRPDDGVTVRLLGMPVRVFADYRIWYEELRRELRLLALNHGSDYPVAKELSEVTLQVEQERRQAVGLDALDRAVAEGRECADLEYVVPPTAPATMTRLRELLEEIDVFCREQRLLTLAPTPQQLELRTWYLGEFGRQGVGEEPRPWPGGYTVEDPSPL